MLGAVWRENLRWPDRRIGKDPAHLEQAVAFIRRHRPRSVAVPYWSDRHPDHVAASALLTEAVFNAGLRRYPGRRRGVEGGLDLLLLHQRQRAAVASWSTCPDHYEQKRAALDCHTSQFQRAGAGTAATRLNTPLFRQLIESRDAQFGALAGVRWAEGFVVREPMLRSSLMRDVAMNIGIVCYASVGGSGIIATELGKALAARGHGVHILSSDTPVRLGDYQPGLSFHRVETPSYPLFREPQYLLSLANKIVQVARAEQLDIVHAHYAVPHATAAYLARQILASAPRRRRAARHHHAARHRHHAARQRSVVLGDRRVLHPAVRRRHRRLGEPEGRHLSRARRRRATSGSFPTSSTAR